MGLLVTGESVNEAKKTGPCGDSNGRNPIQSVCDRIDSHMGGTCPPF